MTPCRAVVVEPDVALVLARVLPRDGEDRVALAHQVADQRVLGPEVEDVVLHDPGRDDQDRLRPDLLGRRAVLDQLHEVVAVDHVAGRHRHVPADDVAVRAGCLARELGLRVLEPVAQAAQEVEAALLDGAAHDLGVGPGEVRGREHVEQLAGHEGDLPLVPRRDAAQARRGGLPPVLGQEEGLRLERERQLLPAGVGEAAVARRQCGRRLGLEPERPALGVGREPHPVAPGPLAPG